MAKDFAQRFYKSAAWRDKRWQILRRDLFTCADCGGTATEVHHEIELSPENIDDPSIALNDELLTSLCGDCHKKRTKALPECDEDFYFNERGELTPRGSGGNRPRAENR